jgi:hypothetical protein
VKPILAPMAVEPKPATLTAASQKLLATWVVKTVFCWNLPSARSTQEHARSRDTLATAPETAWMFAKLEPRHVPWSGNPT